jgi:hypothetical protein
LSSSELFGVTDEFQPKVSTYPKSVYVDYEEVINDTTNSSSDTNSTDNNGKDDSYVTGESVTKTSSVVRLMDNSIGIIQYNTTFQAFHIESLPVSNDDVYLTGLALGYRGNSESTSR